MITIPTPEEKIDELLQRLYGEAPVPPPRLVAVAHKPPPRPLPPPRPKPKPLPKRSPDVLYLDLMPTDALRELYEHVDLPCVLKRVCRALREAGPPKTETTLSRIAKDADTLKWAYRVGCPFKWDGLAPKLAYLGAQSALLWARKEGMLWTNSVAVNAARGGHLDLLSCLIKGGAQFDAHELAKKAAGRGHIHILQWLRYWHEFVWDAHLTTAAARNGQLETLKWLRQPRALERPVCQWNSWLVTNAAIMGHLHVVEWATANGARMRHHAMAAAAEHGHFELVRWFRERGCAMNERTCASAAYGGHLEILQFLRSDPFPCPWDAETCAMAARRGSLSLLRWALDNGCPMTFSTWSTAGMKGHVHVLRYLHASGHPLLNVTREGLREDHVSPTRGLMITCAWLRHMRSPWQRVRNAVRAAAIGRYWWNSARANFAR